MFSSFSKNLDFTSDQPLDNDVLRNGEYFTIETKKVLINDKSFNEIVTTKININILQNLFTFQKYEEIPYEKVDQVGIKTILSEAKGNYIAINDDIKNVILKGKGTSYTKFFKDVAILPLTKSKYDSKNSNFKIEKKFNLKEYKKSSF